MRKLLVFLIFFNFFSSSLQAYSSDPQKFIFELVSDAINRLSDNFRKIPFNIALRIYERLFTFKNNIKSVTTYNYGTINEFSGFKFS